MLPPPNLSMFHMRSVHVCVNVLKLLFFFLPGSNFVSQHWSINCVIHRTKVCGIDSCIKGSMGKQSSVKKAYDFGINMK